MPAQPVDATPSDALTRMPSIPQAVKCASRTTFDVAVPVVFPDQQTRDFARIVEIAAHKPSGIKAALTQLVIRHWRVAIGGLAEIDLIQRLESPGKARMKLLARKPSFA
jgi:hypothetical protein